MVRSAPTPPSKSESCRLSSASTGKPVDPDLEGTPPEPTPVAGKSKFCRNLIFILPSAKPYPVSVIWLSRCCTAVPQLWHIPIIDRYSRQEKKSSFRDINGEVSVQIDLTRYKEVSVQIDLTRYRWVPPQLFHGLDFFS